MGDFYDKFLKYDDETAYKWGRDGLIIAAVFVVIFVIATVALMFMRERAAGYPLLIVTLVLGAIIAYAFITMARKIEAASKDENAPDLMRMKYGVKALPIVSVAIAFATWWSLYTYF